MARGPSRTASYASPIDVRIDPEPTDAERAAILAALARTQANPPDQAQPAWLRAALEDTAASAEEYAFEPSL